MDRANEANLSFCEFCGLICGDRKKKYSHKKVCYENPENDTKPKKVIKSKKYDSEESDIKMMIKLYQQQLEMTKEKNKQQLEIITSLVNERNNVVEKLASAVKTSAETANTGMNMMKYAMLNYKDAPPLEELSKDQIFSMLDYDNDNIGANLDPEKKKRVSKKYRNKNYIKLVINNYDNSDLDSFFGKMIVKFFNKENPEDRQVWTADMSRLSLIIMEVVNKKGEKEWHHDKSGKKFIDLVIDPMFKVVDSLIDEFLKNTENPKLPKPIDPQKVNLKKPPKVKPSESVSSIMNYRQRACELKIDIKYHRFEKDILKYVAPYFNFDKQKLYDQKEIKLLEKDFETSNLDSSNLDTPERSSIKPKKVIKKSK
jgi:proteasome lid subunit RPN8/RPN11